MWVALLLTPFLVGSSRPLVLIFTRTDCPTSNRYAPELQKLFNSYSNIADFQLVYVETGLTSQSMQRHRAEYGLSIPAVIDEDRKYVQMAGTTVTPEAAVFINGTLVYRGRIDDRNVGSGIARKNPERRDLSEVLALIAAGKHPPLRLTPAIGCAIETPR